MQIIRAEVLGFCFGVKRAVSEAEAEVEKNKSQKKILTLGPLIHNPVVLDSLKKQGVNILSEEEICSVKKDDIVIIRAHGTTPEVIENLRSKGAIIIDETCPRVHISQLRAEEWATKGYQVIIAGDKNHGEVVGISGYAKNNAAVVQDCEDAETLIVLDKAILIAQTTFSPEMFEKISLILKAKNKKLLVFNTICTATMERQNALKKLKGQADGIIVIGGKTSANTRRLFETAKTCAERAALIEDSSQIPEEFYKLKTVAITAGASTPDSVIQNVENKLCENGYQ